MNIEAKFKDEAKARKERLFGTASSKNIIGSIRLQKERELAEQRRREEEKAENERRRQEKVRLFREELARRKMMAELCLMIGAVETHGSATATVMEECPTPAIIGEMKYDRMSMESIALTVLEKHPGITLQEIKAHNRRTPIMLARRDVIVSIHKIRPDLSLPAIGKFVCKDHTTVIHAIRRHEEESRG